MNVQHSIASPVRCEISTTGLMSQEPSGGAVGLDRQLLRHNLARQSLDVTHDMGPRSRQADVRRIDPESIDEVKDLNLLLDGRAADRR
jgi:hypothetical protein